METNKHSLIDKGYSELPKRGDLIEGKVHKILKDFVVFVGDIKSHAYIGSSEFEGEELEVGSTFKLQVITLDNGKGESILSRSKARHLEDIEKIQRAFEEESAIACKVLRKIRGGYLLSFGTTVTTFLPESLSGSQDLEPEQVVDVKVIKLDLKQQSFIVSRKAILYAANKEARDELLANLSIGDRVIGIVKNITHFGAFMDIGGVDSLLHITDICWERIRHPSEIVAIGDKIEVEVLDIDQEKGRITLSRKNCLPDPWKTTEFKVDDIFTGKVTSITDYGCFVSIFPGVEGLVHYTEISWNKILYPKSAVKAGEQVQVKVKSIDRDNKKISFSMKACTPTPTKLFAQEHRLGDVITGHIQSIREYGIFVKISEQLSGLVQNSDAILFSRGERKKIEYRKGDEVKVRILNMDIEKNRIDLGMKQVDAFDNFFFNKDVKSVVQGQVEEEGKFRLSMYLTVDIDQSLFPNTILQAGDTISAQIQSLDLQSQELVLEEYQQKPCSSQSNDFTKENIGDLIRERLKKST